MTERPGLDFSFSGLKTAVVVALRGRTLDDQSRADAALAFEEAVVDTLVMKSKRAIEATDARTLVVAGGVGANRRLRTRMLAMGGRLGVRVAYPRAEFCTDNAAMIALLGHLRLSAGRRGDLAISGTRALVDERVVAAGGRLAVLSASADPSILPTLPTIPPMTSMTSSSGDVIFLAGLTVDCIVGIWDWERRVKQKVVLDLEMATESAAPRRRTRSTTPSITSGSRSGCWDSSVTRSSSWSRHLRSVSRNWSSPEFDVPWVRVRLNKQGAIRGARDVGILIERRREDYAAPKGSK